jgi:hypothetical protein
MIWGTRLSLKQIRHQTLPQAHFRPMSVMTSRLQLFVPPLTSIGAERVAGGTQPSCVKSLVAAWGIALSRFLLAVLGMRPSAAPRRGFSFGPLDPRQSPRALMGPRALPGARTRGPGLSRRPPLGPSTHSKGPNAKGQGRSTLASVFDRPVPYGPAFVMMGEGRCPESFPSSEKPPGACHSLIREGTPSRGES